MGNSIYTEIIYIKFTNKNIQLLIFTRFADSLSASTQHLGWFFPLECVADLDCGDGIYSLMAAIIDRNYR